LQIRKYKNYKDPRNFRLFLVGVSLFSLTIGVFTASTVAWFDISNNLVVNSLTIGTEDKSGVKISFSEDGSLYSNVTPSIFEENTGITNKMPLVPVTGTHQSDWLNEDTVFEETVPVLHVGPLSDDVAGAGYYQFPMYFVLPDSGYVYLDKTTTIKANSDENEKTSRKLGIAESVLNQIEGCTRVSFYSDDCGYKIYEPNVDDSSKTYLGGRLDFAPFDGYYDFDSMTQSEKLYGEYTVDSDLYYGVASSKDTGYSGELTCFNSGTKAGIRPLDIQRSIEKGGLKIKQEQTYSWRDLEPPTGVADVGNPITYCRIGDPKKVIVTIYCEGWDLDTVGSIIQSSLNMKLVFTAKYMPKIGS
jgi:hypothetical protein